MAIINATRDALLQRVPGPLWTEVNSVGERSFSELFGPLVQPAYRLACAMLHDAQAAEDAVQEASLIAWRKLRHLEDQSQLRPWFLGIVANECRNAKRRGWRTTVSIGLPNELSVASTEDGSVRRADLRPCVDWLMTIGS